MEMNRRKFMQFTGAGLMLAGSATVIPLTAFETGCTFESVMSQINDYVPVGLAAFGAIVNILGPAVLGPAGPAITLAIALVKAGFADLQVVIKNYEDAPAAQKQTLLGKVATALAAVENSLQSFWGDLNLPDPGLATLIQGLMSVILSTLQFFINKIGIPVVNAAKKAGAKILVVAPKQRSPKQFKQSFNALLPAQYAQYAI